MRELQHRCCAPHCVRKDGRGRLAVKAALRHVHLRPHPHPVLGRGRIDCAASQSPLPGARQRSAYSQNTCLPHYGASLSTAGTFGTTHVAQQMRLFWRHCHHAQRGRDSSLVRFVCCGPNLLQ